MARRMARQFRGLDRPPWWAWVVMAIAAAWIVAAIPLISHRQASANTGGVTAATPTTAAPSNAGTTVAVLGDSWAEGTGADRPNGSFAYTMADKLGWHLHLDAEGGTGYVNPGPAGNDPPRTDFQARAALFNQQSPAPNVIIVAGGLNDRNLYEDDKTLTADQFSKAVGATLDTLHQQVPGAKIVVVGLWWGNGVPTPGAVKLNSLVHDQASQRSLPFIDPMTDGWFTPDNYKIYTSADRVHPNQAGHDYIAGKMVDALKTLGLAS